MALSAEVKLSADQDSLEVAVGVRLGKVDLKICPAPSLPGTKYSRIYPVLYQIGENVAVLKLKRNSKSSDAVTYTVTAVKDGEVLYKGSKMPPVSSVHKGVAYKLNRFLGKVVFRISADEMAHWAKSVARDMIGDARRHARNMITTK